MHRNDVSTHSGTVRSPRQPSGELRRRRLLDLADRVRRLSLELAAVTNEIDELASEAATPTFRPLRYSPSKMSLSVCGCLAPPSSGCCGVVI